jgi:WD40 repeat protein
MEAVVKSLDPNATAHRDAILDTATEIIGHVVKTSVYHFFSISIFDEQDRFPTVDFHMASQRLAVGTSEGAIVMYDLKTAIRLYVLEGHKKQITACSFSPDGRRLVTLSLEESVVLVWKVGSSFSSFFNPGAPPRQGHGGSEPFKTLSFNVGDEGA